MLIRLIAQLMRVCYCVWWELFLQVYWCGGVVKALDPRSRGLGAISLKLPGGNLALNLVYLALKKALKL